jgi:hypothetical protein
VQAFGGMQEPTRNQMRPCVRATLERMCRRRMRSPALRISCKSASRPLLGILEEDPPRRLVHEWQGLYDPERAAEEPSRVTWEIDALPRSQVMSVVVMLERQGVARSRLLRQTLLVRTGRTACDLSADVGRAIPERAMAFGSLARPRRPEARSKRGSQRSGPPT